MEEARPSLGDYRLLRHLARGGMADIYLAENAVGRVVVLKRIRSALAADPNFVQLFLREAKVAMQLDHGNVAQVFDFGEADGSYFLAMEYVDGPNLFRILRAAEARARRIPPVLAAYIVSEVARGLDHAHQEIPGRAGIVHRDVTPQNIVVSRAGEVKLVDFGIAKGEGLPDLTRPGVARGKYLYLAPEQIRRQRADHRVDIYAAGVVLYELLTGRPPFAGDEVYEVLKAIAEGRYAPPLEVDPDLPEALDAVVRRAMAREPADRYGRARDLEADLVAWLRATHPTFGAKAVSAFLEGLGCFSDVGAEAEARGATTEERDTLEVETGGARGTPLTWTRRDLLGLSAVGAGLYAVFLLLGLWIGRPSPSVAVGAHRQGGGPAALHAP
ncbi:MAG: serine/threonine protein kinase, partial [Deltaproteobacteria bacterium]